MRTLITTIDACRTWGKTMAVFLALCAVALLALSSLATAQAADEETQDSTDRRLERERPSQDEIEARFRQLHEAEVNFRTANEGASEEEVSQFLQNKFGLMPLESEPAASQETSQSNAMLSTTSLNEESDADDVKMPQPEAYWDPQTFLHYASASFEWKANCNDDYCWKKDKPDFGGDNGFGLHFEGTSVNVKDASMVTWNQNGDLEDQYDRPADQDMYGAVYKRDDEYNNYSQYTWHEGLITIGFKTREGCDPITLRQHMAHTWEESHVKSVGVGDGGITFTFTTEEEHWKGKNANDSYDYYPCN